MRMVRLIFLATSMAAAVLPATAAAPAARAVFPKSFQGVWALNEADCGNAEERWTITAGGMRVGKRFEQLIRFGPNPRIKGDYRAVLRTSEGGKSFDQAYSMYVKGDPAELGVTMDDGTPVGGLSRCR